MPSGAAYDRQSLRLGRAYVGAGCTIAGAPAIDGWGAGNCTSPTDMNSVKISCNPFNPNDPRQAWLVYDPTTVFEGCRDTNCNELVHEFPAVIPGEALPGQRQTIDPRGLRELHLPRRSHRAAGR